MEHRYHVTYHRMEEQMELDKKVREFKEKGAKIMKERQKERMKFECPFVDPVTNTRFPKTYATLKYPGVLKHLRTCNLPPFQGNEDRLQEYLRAKNISLET